MGRHIGRNIGRRVAIRAPGPDDEEVFIRLARASRELHRPWTAAPVSGVQYRTWLQRMAQPGHAAFLICRRD